MSIQTVEILKAYQNRILFKQALVRFTQDEINEMKQEMERIKEFASKQPETAEIIPQDTIQAAATGQH